MIGGLPAEWGACSHTVTLPTRPHDRLAYWRNTPLACWKDTIAVGLQSCAIIILDAITGSQVADLSRHDNYVRSLAFSVDGMLLVSGSDDRTAKLWDIQTGGIIKTYDHTSEVLSVSISPDSNMLASGCTDGSIHLWGVWTGACSGVIDGHSNNVTSIKFSPTNPQYLLSASEDHTIKQWDIDGSQIGPAHEGNGVAFSPNGTQFVSWREKVATIQDFKFGAVVARLQVPSDKIHCCCFSPSSELLAGSAGGTIYVWDITCSDPHLFKTFVGHTDDVNALTFSSSLVSVSRDMSVKFWQIGISPADPVAVATLPTPLTSAPIHSVSLQVREGIAISCDSDGVVKTWDIFTGFCKSSFQTPAKDSYFGDVQLIEGRVILVWYAENTIHIWDTEKDELLQTVEMEQCYKLKISGDGSKIFCQAKKSVEVWSMWTGEHVGQVVVGRGKCLSPLIADGSKLWVCSEGSSDEGWDLGTSDSSPILSPNTLPDSSHLDFIWGTLWFSGGPSQVNHTATGREIFQLTGRYAQPCDAWWDGQYLVAGYNSGEVLILDFNPVVLRGM